MNIPTEAELTEAIKNATRLAITSLFEKHPEKFYYCSLITDGSGHSPILSAWSEEALEKSLLMEKIPDEARPELKWSYADSPYYGYGEEHFEGVAKLFELRSFLLDIDSEKEYVVRMNAMEHAMAELDKEGLFGKDETRLGIVINAEVMPPDYGNTERGIRLNPKEAITEWLEEIAEEE